MHDTIARFIADRCDVQAFSKVEKSNLWGAYRDWAQRAGLQPVLWSVFAHHLTSYLPINLDVPEFFSGIRIKLPVVGGFVADRSSPFDRS